MLGTSLCVSMEMAAFYNAIAFRYFDGADTFPSGGGHPIDCWAGLIAVAQEVDADVRTLFQSVVVECKTPSKSKNNNLLDLT